jgi:iron complex transport system substrate-binding protein
MRLTPLYFISLSLLLACGPAQKRELVENAPLISQSYTDDTGRKVALPQAPKRIVSLAPNVTEMIYALGGEDKLVARSQACDYPEAVNDIPRVTTYPAFSLEEIKGTGGDLILTTDEIFSPDKVEQLSRLDIPIYLQSYQSLSDVYRGIRDLGKLLDRQEAANAVADSLADLEKRIVAETEDEVKYRTLIIVSAYPEILVVGGSGFLHELIENAGGRNIFADKNQAYYSTTVEEILYRQPEYLILPSENDQVYAELLSQHPALYNTPADEQKQVHVVNPDWMYRPGPRMLEGLLQLTHILHTQLNRDMFVSGPAPQ